MTNEENDESIKIMQLRSFCMIAKCGKVSEAADNLFRTQSAVTRSVRELEDTLGVTLFERHASGMMITDFGKCILPRAQKALAELRQIPKLLGKLKERGSEYREEAEPIWLFNLRRLEVFVALHRFHHTVTAAHSLGVSQPAISASLKVLEKGASVSLFQRTPRGLMPTAAGREIAPVISRAINEISHIKEDIAARQGVLTGTVNIGALPLSRTSLLPEAIAQLVAVHPGIRIFTNESAFSGLITELRSGDVDFILGALRKEEDFFDTENTLLFEEELVMLVGPQHPLLHKPLQLEDLATAQWILPRSKTPARRLLDKAFANRGLPPLQPVVESGDLAIVRGLLLRTEMIAVVSSQQLAWELENDILHPLNYSLHDTRRDIGLIFRQGSLHSPSALAVIDTIKSMFSQR
ncbi:LysR family transcriptional regulator [Pantoea vagans]|uniref:LysR family transcriptional regulator n=1 Tax=Pantoea vagans TaxID=470934 RepID=UPI003017E318